MGWTLRTENDVNNPTLPGGVYGKYITAGRGVYFRYDGSRTRYIIFISDGGLYGMDSVTSVEYNGTVQDEDDWIFHPGTFPAQIVPFAVSDIDTGTDVLTVTGHPYADTDLVRLGVTDGQLPAVIDPNLRYQVASSTTNTLKIKDEAGVGFIDFADEGTGSIIIWAADAGFDDPVQGLPTFVPEVETTFNNIAYIEGMLTSGASDPVEPPEWENFRIYGLGRRLMEYDDEGNELGVILGDVEELSNVAHQIIDNYIVSYRGSVSRPNWATVSLLKSAADVLLLQPAEADDTETATPSFTGIYYYYSDFTLQVLTRQDAAINFTWNTSPPAPGMPSTWYSVRWTGKIKPTYTEQYNFTLSVDDIARLYIDGILIADVGIGVHFINFNMVAGREYDLQVDYIQTLATGAYVSLFWESASQTAQAVPPSAEVGSTDVEVRRYENHMAFPIPTEASEVHERLMERAPGWDWTDDAGLITFLPPDRPEKYVFIVDPDDDDVAASVVNETFQKRRRPIAERPNFLLFRYRDVLQEGYPFKFVQADRDDLRRFTNGEPTNNPAEDLGVSTRSLAARMAEYQMVIKSDPEHTASISGGRAAGKVRKNHFVRVKYYDRRNRQLADGKYLATFASWGAEDGRNDFSLLPVPTPYYQDNAIVVFQPADLPSIWGVWEPDSYNLADGSNATTDWLDKTVNGRDMTVHGTPTYNMNEINGRAAITLGVDSNDYLQLPSMSGLTEFGFFMVLNVLDNTTGGGFTLGTAADRDHYPWSWDWKIYSSIGSNTRTPGIDLSISPLQNNWHIFWGWSAVNDRKLFQDQTEIYSSTTNTVSLPVVPRIGFNGSEYMKTKLGGLYFMSAKPTETEVANMLGYISRHFAL